MAAPGLGAKAGARWRSCRDVQDGDHASSNGTISYHINCM